MMRCLRYAQQAHDEILSRRAQALKEIIRPASANKATAAAVVSSSDSDIQAGHRRMTNLLRMLQSFDNYDDLFLELMQVMIALRICHSLAGTIYGSTLHSIFRRQIEKRFGIDKSTSAEFAVALARRMGKSVLIAVVIAAWALTQPEKNVCVFSKASTQSEDVVGKVRPRKGERETIDSPRAQARKFIIDMIRINGLAEQGYSLKNDSVGEISVRHPCGSQTRIVARGSNEVVRI